MISYGICLSLWLISLSIIISRSIHVAANGIISFFLIAEQHSTVCMNHISIHSSLDGHLDSSYVLAIVNSAAMNIGVHVPLQTMVFSGYLPRNGTAGSYGSSIFKFLKDLHTVLQNAAPIYIPINSIGGFPFLHIFSSIINIFGDGHSDWCAMIPHNSFDLHFSND